MDATPATQLVDAERLRWKRDVTIFLTSQTVSLFGSMLVQYAIVWHLTLSTKSRVVLALAAVFGFLPQAFVSIFFVDVVTAIIGIVLLMTLADPTICDFGAQRPSYFADLIDGVRYVAHHAFVRWLLIMYAIVFVLIVAPVNLTPLMVVRSFGAEVWKLTATEVAFSIGMVLGSIVITAALLMPTPPRAMRTGALLR